MSRRMVDVLFYLVAVAALGAAAHRVLRWRSRRHEDAPMVATLTALAFAFIFLAPTSQAVESTLLPGLGRLLSNLCTLAAAFGFTYLQLSVAYTPDRVSAKLRTRVPILVGVITGLVVTFFLGKSPGTLGLFDYRGDIWLTLCALLYSLYLTTAMIDLLVVSIRSFRYTRGYLRVAMTVMGIGHLLGLVYTTSKIYNVLRIYLYPAGAEGDLYCAGPFSRVDCTLSIGMPALAVLAIVGGISIPPAARQLAASMDWWTERRTYLRLAPLWTALYGAIPEIALTSSQAVEGQVSYREMPLRVYRRAVEVRDGALVLHPHRTAADTVAHREHGLRIGLRGTALAAAVEAADLATALARRASGLNRPIHSSSEQRPVIFKSDRRAEAEWLGEVSRAFRERRIKPLPGVSDDARSSI